MIFVSLRLLGWYVVRHYLRCCDHHVAVLVSHRFYVIPLYNHRRRRLGLLQSESHGPPPEITQLSIGYLFQLHSLQLPNLYRFVGPGS